VAAEEFHPRFDALSRRYCYRLFCQPLRDPLREKLAWRVWPPVNAARLRKAALLFLGTHDFSAFGSATSSDGSTVRTVQSAGWSRHGDEWLFEIAADAFLYRMVRRLVFLQVAHAQGRCSLEALSSSLTDPGAQVPGALPAGLAPAHGLVLAGVTYDR
jgi:tRNA pseudouridine38-40 synthase